jgi:hypothetical protein
MLYYPGDGMPFQTFVECNVDVTTTSTTFVDVVQLAIGRTPAENNSVIVYFSASVSLANTSVSADFQLVIDGVAVRGTSAGQDTSTLASACALVYKTGPLTATNHTFKIQWKVSAATTARIRPVATTEEHGSLLIQEVSV